jgi:ubiquinone/menaquinone biosynthesis C-methylase UbiE
MADTPSYFTDGAAYDRLMGRWSRAAGEVFLDWLSLPSRLRWLDVGCGTGVFTALLIERCKAQSVSAVDPAADQIAYARTKAANKDVDFHLADAQSLPFADRTFDAAAMALVMSFVPDAAKAVAEMKRVVKPGGTIGTYVWDFLGNASPPQPLRMAVEAMGYSLPPMPGHRNSQLENLKGYFAGASLDEVAARPIAIEVTYANFDEFWLAQTALANPTVQHIRKMTDAEVERLKAYLREHLPTDKFGRIAYKARANAAKGRVPG